MSWFDNIHDHIAGDRSRRAGERSQTTQQDAKADSATGRTLDTHDARDAVFEAVLAEEAEARRQFDDALDGISATAEIEQADARWRAAVQDCEAAWHAHKHGGPGWRARGDDRRGADAATDCERAVRYARDATQRAKQTRPAARGRERERIERWRHADNASTDASAHTSRDELGRGEGSA